MIAMPALSGRDAFVVCTAAIFVIVLIVSHYWQGPRVIQRLLAALGDWSGRSGRARPRSLSAWAEQRGWDFEYGPDDFPEKRDFWAFRKGRPSYIKYSVKGEHSGRRVLAFDYCYTVTEIRGKGGAGSALRELSAVTIEVPFPLKRLLIRRERLSDKAKQAIGMEDINFESAKFSRRYFVASEDAKWAYDVLNQSTMEFLMVHDRGAAIEFSENKVLAWFSNTMSVLEFEATVELLTGILDRIPDYVIAEQMPGCPSPESMG
jgi:hypothetical protein